MCFDANKPIKVYRNYKVKYVVDGDGVVVYNIFSKKDLEIRLLGIDAPEIKDCIKHRRDENENHIPGQLLIELGLLSKNYLHNLLPKETNVTFITEIGNETDPMGRTLAYLLNNEGLCINEKMILDGYAKPYSKYYCVKLEMYQELNVKAMHQKKGLYAILHKF